MNKVKSQKKKFGLKNISLYVLETIKSLRKTTRDEIANKLLFDFDEENKTNQDTLRRRVCDVVIVLASLGLVTLVGKDIVYNSDVQIKDINENSDDPEIKAMNMEEKKKILKEKICLLTFYKSIIKRNIFSNEEPNKKYHLPAIVVGVEDVSQSDVSLSKDKKNLIFSSKESITNISINELMKRIGIKPESFSEFLETSYEYKKYIDDIIVQEK